MEKQNKDDVKKASCCETHPMYVTVACIREECHEGLHRTFHEGEFLRWGVPSEQEKYDVVRVKENK